MVVESQFQKIVKNLRENVILLANKKKEKEREKSERRERKKLLEE